jgi:hypothetical protein
LKEQEMTYEEAINAEHKERIANFYRVTRPDMTPAQIEERAAAEMKAAIDSLYDPDYGYKRIAQNDRRN